MSIIEKLTEGIVNRDLQKEGAALLDKWTQTGLLEGLQTDQAKQNMARLLENQAKELLRESSSMSAGDVEGFAAVAFPIVRRVFAGLIANDLVSVQPMSLPSGLIFFLDFVFSPNVGANGTQSDPRMGNSSNKSIYGTDQVGSEITGGVDLVGATLNESLSGPRQMTGYAYGSPSGSNASAIDATGANHYGIAGAFLLNGSVSEANKKLIQYDADLLAETTHACLVVDILDSTLAPTEGVISMDYDNLSAFQIDNSVDGGIDLIISGSDAASITNQTHANTKQIRRLTSRVASTDSTNAVSGAATRFVLVSSNTTSFTAGDLTRHATNGDIGIGKISFPVKDHIPVAGTVGAVQSTSTNYALEANAEIPEIDIKVDSIAITAQTKKLKAKWTPELGQDLNAYHNLDAEVELTSILSEQIALEIDREILADLVNGGTAATYYWSRSPGLFVNRQTGAEIGQTSAAPDFTGTVSEWYETLIETINDVSAQIHRKTLRGGANFVIVSPEVANILEFTAGFRANVTADADKGDMGAVKVGSLNRKFDIIVDPYFPRNVVLVGRRGSSFLESGYVYAPYVPLQTTPTIFGVEDFVPRKGVMTRYAKKMVRPDMYGLVIVRGLLGEAGATS